MQTGTSGRYVYLVIFNAVEGKKEPITIQRRTKNKFTASGGDHIFSFVGHPFQKVPNFIDVWAYSIYELPYFADIEYAKCLQI